MSRKTRTIYLKPETDYELRRLQKLWEMESISAALVRCIFITGNLCRKSSDRTITDMAKSRFYEAGQEMVEAEKKAAGHE